MVRRKIRTCPQCGATFTRRANQSNPKYCSPECFAQGRCKGRNLKTYSCKRCGKEFERYESTVRNPERVYCSGFCRDESRVYKIGPDHPQWTGGTYISGGYCYERDYSKRRITGDYGYRATHLRVAEETLGRLLAPGEHVHHLNGVKLDNRPENLLALSNSDHRALHGYYSQQFQLEHEKAGDLCEITVEFLRERGVMAP
jgi:hypothetical protein